MEEIGEDNNSGDYKELELPKIYRIWIIIFCLMLSFSIIIIYFYLIFFNPNWLDPSKFGLSSLLIFALTLLLFVTIPWKKLGFRIKKIGIIELEEKVEGQAKDVSKDIADLQVKIDSLEKRIDSNAVIESTELEQLIVQFLKLNSSYAFSPMRIKKWGATRAGFSNFNNYSIEEIKVELRRLLAKNVVSTRISEHGNTLYIYNKWG